MWYCLDSGREIGANFLQHFSDFCGGRLQKSWRGLPVQNLAAQICWAARWLTILGLFGYPECDAGATLGAAALGHEWRLTREAEDVARSSVMPV